MDTLLKIALTALLSLCFTSPVLSQEQATEEQAPGDEVCESNKRFNDFDFWVGEWNVYSNNDEKQFQGTNIITKHHKNCLIMENWTSVQGGTGSSMNYYDAVEDQWRQLWVAGGYSIDYSGGLTPSGSMLLTGKINYYQSGKSQAFRGTWTANTDGSVRQFFEQQNLETSEWDVWFDGLYVKRANDLNTRSD